MSKKETIFPFFLTFFILSLLLIIVGKSGIINNSMFALGIGSAPLRGTLISVVSLTNNQNEQIQKIISENKKLRRQVVERTNLAKENEDLKLQFLKSSVPASSLLPAKVIGSSGFIPGESIPNYLIIDKGIKDSLREGSVVIFEDNLIGRISSVGKNTSKVTLIINKEVSFPAVIKSGENTTQGIINGSGDGLLFENVLLTSQINPGDIIITKGNIDKEGDGFSPNLIVGRVISIDRETSELFQKAKVESFIDFPNLENVFVIK